MPSTITKKQIEKYYKLTSQALEIVKKNIAKNKREEAREIIDMASNYLKDSLHFKNKNDYINSFGAIYYAHGWIDCGVRLGVFNVKDDKLFTVR